MDVRFTRGRYYSAGGQNIGLKNGFSPIEQNIFLDLKKKINFNVETGSVKFYIIGFGNLQVFNFARG
jgi:hypothetical protein